MKSAKIQTTTPITWSTGELFDGFLAFGLVKPSSFTGLNVRFKTYAPSITAPDWVPVPIERGQINQTVEVPWSTEYSPTCRYVLYWFDNNWQRIFPSNAPTPFDITNVAIYYITQPNLTAPAPTVIPVPQGSTLTTGLFLYSQNLTSVTSVVIPGPTHNIGTYDLMVELFSDEGSAYQMTPFPEVEINKTTFDVTLTFSDPFTGKVVIF